ncbi:MAG: Crp/Fnr family transcriptional regulator [Candidatus Dormibacteria bacterium]
MTSSIVIEETFVSSLSEAELADLQAMGRRRQFRKTSPILVEGEVSDRVAFIISGRVKVSLNTDDGKEVLLALRGPGDLLGELSFLDGEPRSATAAALEAVEAQILTAEEFKRFLENHPRAALNLLQMLSRRLREADQKLIEFTAYDSVGRVARRLLELAERYGQEEEDGIRIDLPLSQEELAGWTGSSREAVSKALGTLRQLGWIETRRRGVTILDLKGLSRRAS